MSPIIGFTEKDLLRGTVVTPAWYRLRIDGVGEKLARNGESTNYPVEETIICNADDGSTTFANVPIDYNFNSKAIGFAVGFLKALGQDVAVGKRFNLADAAGKEIEQFIGNKLYEGRVINDPQHQYRAVR